MIAITFRIRPTEANENLKLYGRWFVFGGGRQLGESYLHITVFMDESEAFIMQYNKLEGKKRSSLYPSAIRLKDGL